MISSLTKNDLLFERRKAVAQYSTSCTKGLTVNVRIREMWELLEKSKVFTREPELFCCYSIGSTARNSDDRHILSFYAEGNLYKIECYNNITTVAPNFIEFMMIEPIYNSICKDIFILADGKLMAYRGCSLSMIRTGK